MDLIFELLGGQTKHFEGLKLASGKLVLTCLFSDYVTEV